MFVGFTYDIKSDYAGLALSNEELAECDTQETVDILTHYIESFGHQVDRIGNVKNLCRRLAHGDRWDFVFNFAEGLWGSSREAQIPSLLEAFQIPFTFSDARLNALVLDKALTKILVRSMDVPSAEFWLVKSMKDLNQIPQAFPLFAKPTGEGSSKGVYSHSRVSNFEGLQNICQELLERFKQPVLVEKFLSGREMTVGVIGTGSEAKVLGVLEVCFLKEPNETAVYTHALKQDPNWGKYIEYRVLSDSIGQQAAELALKAWRGLGGFDCGRIDVRFDEKGIANFIELNAIPGLARSSDIVILSEKLGISHRDLIGKILETSQKRLGLIK